MLSDAYLKPESIKIRQLLADYRTGRIVIPEFQREYVWKPSQAPKLLDSLYRNYPVASLLLWQSGDGVRSRRGGSQPVEGRVTTLLIDGQQRLTTLSRALSVEQTLDVVFNPKTEAFALANAATRKDRDWISVSAICDDDSYFAMRRNLGEGRSEQRIEEKLERVRRILDYEIPVVRMIGHSFNEAVEAFTRINTLGVRLKKNDIESARVAAAHSGFIAERVVPFVDSLRRGGFSRLGVTHLFRVCAFVARPDGRNRTPLHELSTRDVEAAWKETEKATTAALGLVQSGLGLINMDILWSGTLLVPIVALHATTRPRERDSEAMIGWLALAALLHRYSGAAETALEQDLKACRGSDPIGALLANLRATRPSLAAEPRDFATMIADRSAMLAMYIACRHRGIRNFFTGGAIAMQRDVDRHHILPRAQFPEKERDRADRIANIVFISGPVNRSIGMSGPEVYLKQIDARTLASQCVPNVPNLWSIEQAEFFWKARQTLLAEAFNDFLRACFPQRRVVVD